MKLIPLQFLLWYLIPSQLTGVHDVIHLIKAVSLKHPSKKGVTPNTKIYSSCPNNREECGHFFEDTY